MRYLPKTNQLKVFQEIIKHGSIRAAARALNQSQPALTRIMRELEENLGTGLITRGIKGIRLTEAGRLFSVRMEAILNELQKATEEIRYVNELSEGSIAVGFSPLIGLTIFPAVLAEFRKFLPKTRLTIKDAQLSSLFSALRENRLDFAIGSISENLPLNEFIEEPLFKAPFSILCRKGHPLEGCVHLSELKQAKWIIPETDMGYYLQIQNLLGSLYHPFQHEVLTTSSIIYGLNLVLQSDYILVVANAMSQPLMLQDHLSIMPIKDELPEATFSLIYSRNAPLTLAANRMIKIFRWHCQNTDWSKSHII